jgi:hypothetical protein
MRTTFRSGSGRIAVVLAVVGALLSQGCILEKKTIVDVYKFVTPVDPSERQLINVMSFGSSYCIQPGDLNFSAKLSPVDPLMTALLVQAVLVTVATGTIVDTWDFSLPRKGATFKGKFPLSSGFCVADGQQLEWYVTPFGAAIGINTKVTTKFTYRADT